MLREILFWGKASRGIVKGVHKFAIYDAIEYSDVEIDAILTPVARLVVAIENRAEWDMYDAANDEGGTVYHGDGSELL